MESREITILVTLVAYKVVLVLIGLWASRRIETADDYLIGGRKVGPIISGFSYAASTSSAWVLLGVSGFIFTTGLSALWMIPGIWGGYVAMWLWAGPALRAESADRQHVTMTDYLTAALVPSARRWIAIAATLMIVFCFVFYIAAQFDAAAKALVDHFDLSMTEAVLIGAGIITLYCLLGGFWAVSATDTLQGMVMAVIAFGLPLAVVIAAGGPGGILAEISAVPDPGFVDMAGGMGPFLFLGFVVGLWGIGLGALGQPHLLSRLMALESEEARRTGFRIAMLWAVLVYAGMAALALGGRALVASGHMPMPLTGETMFYEAAGFVLPPVFAGIVIAATLSAVMSTVDSILLAAAAAVAHDLGLNRWRPGAAVLLSRVTMLGIAAFGVVLTLTLPDTIFNRVLFAWSALGAAFGPVIVARVARWQPAAWAILTAMLVGFAVTVFFYTLGTMPDGGEGPWSEIVMLARLPGDPFERVVPWIVPLILLRVGRDRQG